MKRLCTIMLACAQLGTVTLSAVVDFGSQDSAIIIAAGDLSLTADASFAGGTIVIGDSGSVDTGGAVINLAQTAIVRGSTDVRQAAVLTGSYNFSDAFFLTDGEEFVVDGGYTPETVVVLSSYTNPAFINGSGVCEHLELASGGAESGSFGMNLSWSGPYSLPLYINTPGLDAYVYLKSDLTFVPGVGCSVLDATSLTLACDYNTLTIGGDYTEIGATQTWDNAIVSLRDSLYIASEVGVLFTGRSIINGNNAYIELDSDAGLVADGDLTTMADVTIVTPSAVSQLYGSTWELKNVTLLNGNQESLTVVHTYAAGFDPFVGDFIAEDETQLSLNTDVTLGIGARWTFAYTTTINGNGQTLSVVGGATIGGGADTTIYLRDMTLEIDSNSFGGMGCEFDLSNVTVVLTETVDWSEITDFSWRITGPVTFIVDTYSFSAPIGGAGSVIDSTTVWYDDLGTNIGNVSGFDYSGHARVISVTQGSMVLGDQTIVSDDDLFQSRFLYVGDDTVESQTITFNRAEAGAIEIQGHGRALICPVYNSNAGSQEVLTIASDNTEVHFFDTEFNDVIISQHFNITGSGSSFIYRDGCVFRLGDSTPLPTNFVVGAFDSVEEMVTLDLQGHTLYLTKDIVIDGAGAVALKIINGRIEGLGSSLIALADGNQLVLQDVTLALDDDFTFSNGAVSFYGDCVIEANAAVPLRFTYSSTDSFTIGKFAHVTIGDGVIFAHDSGSSTNIYFADASSTLEFVGSTLRHVDNEGASVLVLNTGTVIFDHKVVLEPGAAGTILAAQGVDGTLSVIIRPGAQVIVKSSEASASGELSFEYVAA